MEETCYDVQSVGVRPSIRGRGTIDPVGAEFILRPPRGNLRGSLSKEVSPIDTPYEISFLGDLRRGVRLAAGLLWRRSRRHEVGLAQIRECIDANAERRELNSLNPNRSGDYRRSSYSGPAFPVTAGR